MTYDEWLKRTSDRINLVSKSFCAAKWMQVTLHLHNGTNHSCHHNKVHKINVDDIKQNYKALHNTKHKKQSRKEMLQGTRPAECDYCWKIEDSSADTISDRIYKSGMTWAYPYIDNIVTNKWDQDIDPSYLEINFSNVCNFKCSYCSPNVSSKWMEEIEQYGPYPTSTYFNNIKWLESSNTMPIPNREANPYIDAFWQYFPEIEKKLHTLRVTGGEPLLSKDTFKLIDHLIDSPNNNLAFGVNTNLNPPEDILDKFIERLKILSQKVKEINLFTSAEAWGACSEYIRFGMNYNSWLKNIKRILDEIPNIYLIIMSTYNILSITSYDKFLLDVLQLKQKYNKAGEKIKVLLDIPYLNNPAHQSIFILEKPEQHFVKSHLSLMESVSVNNIGFINKEIDQMKRINSLLHTETENSVAKEDFVKFIDEHDKRRNTNFLTVFPELKEMYLRWKK